MHKTRFSILIAAGVSLIGAALAGEHAGHWTQGAPMPSERGEVAAAALDGKIYLNRWRGSAIVDLEIYDPSKNQWSRGTKFPRSSITPQWSR